MVRGFEGTEEGGLAEGLVGLPGLSLLLVVETAAADEGLLEAGGRFHNEAAEGGQSRHVVVGLSNAQVSEKCI